MEPFRDDLRAAHEKVARLEEQNAELAWRVRAAEAEARRARAATNVEPAPRTAGASVTFAVIAVVALAGVGAAAAVSMLLARRPPPPPAITVVTVPASVAPVVTAPEAVPAHADPADAERTIAALRPRFRACYDKGLAADPSMTGSMTVVLVVRADGAVTVAHAEEESGLSSQVSDCIVQTASRAHFAPSATGQATTVRVPVRFVQAP